VGRFFSILVDRTISWCTNQREREMEMERNDVTDHPGWRNSPGVGDEEAVAAPVGLPIAGSVTL
jgi:hypothetical protein